MQPLDVGLGQRLGGGVDDVIHAEQVIGSLNEIIHLDGLEAGLDLVRLEDLRDLSEHQPVAGHAPVGVGEVGLHVVIEAVEHFLGLLLAELFDQGWLRLGSRRFSFLHDLPFRAFCVLRDEPFIIFKDGSFNSSLQTITSNNCG